jgi:hypothetical protein
MGWYEGVWNYKTPAIQEINEENNRGGGGIDPTKCGLPGGWGACMEGGGGVVTICWWCKGYATW